MPARSARCILRAVTGSPRAASCWSSNPPRRSDWGDTGELESPAHARWRADKILRRAEISGAAAADTAVAVTVSCVSVVDRMVSRDYVQTAHPYDRDLAFLGAWKGTGKAIQGPWG